MTVVAGVKATAGRWVTGEAGANCRARFAKCRACCEGGGASRNTFSRRKGRRRVSAGPGDNLLAAGANRLSGAWGPRQVCPTRLEQSLA